MIDGHDVTVCVTTHPGREDQLGLALMSVCEQTVQPRAILVECDFDRTGAAATKNRALARAGTTWVTFLDSDDQMMPQHLEKLIGAQQQSGADVVYPMAYVTNQPGGRDPSDRAGKPFDAAELRRRSYITTTSLIRRDLLVRVGGFCCPPDSYYDDWGGYLALLDAGASFHHLPEQTFWWFVTGPGFPGQAGNTSGQPHRW
jgi:glycosyltransferase involved in cell wall biosynthesis